MPHECEQFDVLAHSEADTARLGALLANALSSGIVVALVGSLGAGKTRLVQEIAAAAGADRKQVNSPTFMLIQRYDGRLPIYHVDAFRLKDADEFLELGVDEWMGTEGICLIEWADRVAEVLPEDRLTIQIDITGPTQRAFHIAGSGPKSNAIVDELSRRNDDPSASS